MAWRRETASAEKAEDIKSRYFLTPPPLFIRMMLYQHSHKKSANFSLTFRFAGITILPKEEMRPFDGLIIL